MKTALLTIACATFSTFALAQGIVNFSNIGVGLNAPVTNWDGTWLAGSAFGADLYWAPGIITDSRLLVGLGAPAYFSTNGYFVGGARTIPGLGSGSIVTVQVRVADSASCPPWLWTFLPCSSPFQHGESGLIQVKLNALPGPPANLVGLTPFGISAPTTASAPRFWLNSMVGGRLVLSWPPSLAGTNFVLQQNADLNTTNWVTITEAPIFVGPQLQIAIPKPTGTMFYRLISQ